MGYRCVRFITCSILRPCRRVGPVRRDPSPLFLVLDLRQSKLPNPLAVCPVVLGRHPALRPDADHVPKHLGHPSAFFPVASNSIVSRTSSGLSNTMRHGRSPPVSISRFFVASIGATLSPVVSPPTGHGRGGKDGSGVSARGPSMPRSEVCCISVYIQHSSSNGGGGDGRTPSPLSAAGFFKLSKSSGSERRVIGCQPASWKFCSHWDIPARSDGGRIGVCCQSIRLALTYELESGVQETMVLLSWMSGWRMQKWSRLGSLH